MRSLPTGGIFGIFIIELLALTVEAKAFELLPISAPGDYSVPIADTHPDDAKRVIADACNKQVVLLGEATHGGGKTFELKIELVRRLIDECNFKAIFIETGMYDFLDYNRRLISGDPVNQTVLSNSLGQLWASTKEIQPLIRFLYDGSTTQRFKVYGMDDQINSTAYYAQRKLPGELARYLKPSEQAPCLYELERYALQNFENSDPYSPLIQSRIVNCLQNIKHEIVEALTDDQKTYNYHLKMAENMERLIVRDFEMHQSQIFNQRDRSMYLNFGWLRSLLPAHSKVIIWTATVHAAKDLSQTISIGQERRFSFGSFIREKYKNSALALGVSAFSGSYAMIGQSMQRLTVAPSNFLEGSISTKNASKQFQYLNYSQLESLGSVSARPINYVFMNTKWSEILDGILVMPEEVPPHFIEDQQP